MAPTQKLMRYTVRKPPRPQFGSKSATGNAQSADAGNERETYDDAWLAAQVMAHNLARWTARIGLGEQVVTPKTLRRRFFSIAGRLTRSARRLTLHLP